MLYWQINTHTLHTPRAGHIHRVCVFSSPCRLSACSSTQYHTVSSVTRTKQQEQVSDWTESVSVTGKTRGSDLPPVSAEFSSIMYLYLFIIQHWDASSNIYKSLNMTDDLGNISKLHSCYTSGLSSCTQRRRDCWSCLSFFWWIKWKKLMKWSFRWGHEGDSAE